MKATATGANGEKRFGAFGGVYTPSILTILGVIMYMRLGWVTGNAGLGGALLIVAASHLLSFITGVSISSIATNRTVGAGGAYYMISRALGAPAGAAIGLPLFFAQALSVTFYIVGFTESVRQLVPHVPPLLVSTAANVLLTALSLKGADLAIKAQYLVMAAIGVSLISFFGGHSPDFPSRIEWFNPEGQPLEQVFAVFFPAVTGIMAGVGMSGDLKDPRSAIPRGTLAAICTGFVVYMAFPVWLALNMSNDALVVNTDAAFTLSAVPALIYVGVWGATISSALGSILTAPRTLQALAADGLAPGFLSKGFGPSREPRAGTLLTFCMAQVGIFLGNLDVIAPVLTMFFLATYGMINLACGLEKWAASPSFRPTFKVSSALSLAGAAGCFYVMSVIDLAAMVSALVLCGVIFVVAERRALGTTYGDARHGIWAALVRSALYRLRRTDFHPRNWRPNLIILGGDPNRRPYLLELGSSIVQDRGIVTYFQLVKGAVSSHVQERKELFRQFEEKIADEFPNVFFRVDIVNDIYPGTVAVAQSYGVGSFECNAVMLGWPNKTERSDAYVQTLRDLVSLDRSLLLVRHNADRHFGESRNIHVWWGGLRGNGGLMLLLAFLLTADFRWRNAKVTVLTVVNDESEQQAAQRNLQALLESARLVATPRVIVRQGRQIPQIMHVESASADLAIIGIRLPRSGEPSEPFFERMNTILEELPTTMLVHSARTFEGEPVLLDSAGD